METITTDISLSESLFDQAEAVAREMNISRTLLFVMALEDFIQRYENRKKLEENGYSSEDELDEDETTRLRLMRRLHRKVLEDES